LSRQKKLRKVYGDKETVKGISFDVAEGEVFGILGPTERKTTTLEMLEAIRPIDGGEAILDGINVCPRPRSR